MRTSIRYQMILPVIVVLAVLSAKAVEKRISRTELPAAVQKTADEQSKGAAVRGYSKETENGQMEYEVELVINGHSKDVTIAPDGRVLEIEEEVSIQSLSPQVHSGLQSKAGKGQIIKVESLTKHGVIVAYEAKVSAAGKHSEIQVGPDGKDLNHGRMMPS